MVVPNDTSAEAERVQIELLRRAGFVQRVGIAVSLRQMVRGLSRRAVRRCMPHATEREVDLRFAELHYGKEVAEPLRQYLESRLP